MQLKPPKTYEEQVNLFIGRGLIVDDKEQCIQLLHRINYYRLTAYLLPFKKSNDTYQEGTTLNQIFQIYEFDRKIRALLFLVIEEIELFLRTGLAYSLSHSYGCTMYLDSKFYNEKHNHGYFLKIVSESIENNKKTPVVKHHKAKYDGHYPLWVLVEFLSMGTLSHFYSDLKSDYKRELSETLYSVGYPYLESWVRCLTVLRNRCAHYSRLYYINFTEQPKLPRKYKEMEGIETGKLFKQILALKLLFPNSVKWNREILVAIESLIQEYEEYVDMKHIGFPENWNEIL